MPLSRAADFTRGLAASHEDREGPSHPAQNAMFLIRHRSARRRSKRRLQTVHSTDELILQNDIHSSAVGSRTFRPYFPYGVFSA